MIPIQTLQSLPALHQATITTDHLDVMGHMNIRHYLGIFDDAAWHLFASIGMDQAYYDAEQNGAFALEHHIRYLAEVHQGETVHIHGRFLGRTAKRIHFMLFMLNQTTGKLAATLEVVGSHADLTRRRTSPFPSAIAARLDAIVAQHQQLGWEAPVCGVMAP